MGSATTCEARGHLLRRVRPWWPILPPYAPRRVECRRCDFRLEQPP